jgi:hypothetical protein
MSSGVEGASQSSGRCKSKLQQVRRLRREARNFGATSLVIAPELHERLLTGVENYY